MLFEKQDYQTNCVNNIIKSLKNIDFDNNDYSQLRENLNTIKNKNNYNTPINNKNQIDVLMETGTGKTFTYLKTIFEIHKQYNQTKFIIVLPRTAIKLGVIQNIKLTKDYFFNEYGKYLNYTTYPEDGINSTSYNFVNNKGLSVLIITSAAFAGKDKNIRKQTDNIFNSKGIWGQIADVKPIVIIDEPHLLKGDETNKAFAELHNSLFIRFGATYPVDERYSLTNVAYILDSITSFNKYLVKQIGVSTVFAGDEAENFSVHNIKAKQGFTLSYAVNTQIYKTFIRLYDDIGAKTGLSQYSGITALKINKGKIFLSNNTILEPNKNDYELSDIEVENMIAKTINLHFGKEEKLFTQNIKTLSLFFIPKIDDFRGNNPRIKNIFIKCYKQIRDDFYQKTTNQAYKKYLDNDYKDGKLQVLEGYFSGDKVSKKHKDVKMNKDDIGIDIILNSKEKLLSFDTPLRFVFSVWALQEGWDNPNIFNICKLAKSDKDTSRRQQVGRGLRLALNSDGRRQTYNYFNENKTKFYGVNALDVVVSSKEQHFIHAIQNEINESSISVIVGNNITATMIEAKTELTPNEAARVITYLEDNEIIDENGEILSPIYDFLKSHRKLFKKIDDYKFNQLIEVFNITNNISVNDNNKEDIKVKIRKSHWQEFKELWEIINTKSKIVYKHIKQDELAQNIANAFNREKVAKQNIQIISEKYHSQTDEIIQEKEQNIGVVAYFNTYNITNFITKFAKENNYSLNFIISVFNQINLDSFKNNPQQASNLLQKIIKEQTHKTMLSCVDYNFMRTTIYPNNLQDKNGKVIDNLKWSLLGSFISDETPKDEFLYDKVIYDSKIEKESITSDATDIDDNKITVFAKLPKINIPTPFKTYNPDFAYILKNKQGEKLFLVVETKGYKFEADIPEQERQKINYAKKFFKQLQQELPEVKIQYKTRISGQSLAELVKEYV